MADIRAKQIAELTAPFRVAPGSRVVLSRDFDPSFKAGIGKKKQGEALLKQGVEMLAEYQDRLAAQDTYGVLVVLQALDAAGKDGTISHVMSGVNPQGVSVASFKSPSVEELDHDYLWRCAKCLPARGDITIFNRSYYEEVLVVRVHPEFLAAERVPAATKKVDIWKRRYRDINNWERYLVDNGFRIVKLFLNISKEEQRRRFLARLDEPDKNWKFSAADAAERKYWDDYQEAFSEMLSHTSTSWAPWHVIPADHKWFARVAAAAVIVDALAKIDPQFPTPTAEAKQGLDQARAALEAEAPKPKRVTRPAAEGDANPEAATVAPAASTEDAGSVPEAPERGADVGLPFETLAAAAADASDGPSTPPVGMVGRVVKFGVIELAGKRYREDLVIDGGKIRRRRKKPSKQFRGKDGHTPLSLAEVIPWGGATLIVGTGNDGALPIMAEVYAEADKRGVRVTAVPLQEALRLLEGVPRREAFAVLHVTC